MSMYNMIDGAVPDGFKFIGVSLHPANVSDCFMMETFQPVRGKREAVFGKPSGRIDVSGQSGQMNVYSDPAVGRHDIVSLYIDNDEKGRLPPSMVKDKIDENLRIRRLSMDGDTEEYTGKVTVVGGGSNRSDDVKETVTVKLAQSSSGETLEERKLRSQILYELWKSISEKVVSLTVDDERVEWVDVQPFDEWVVEVDI